MALIPARDASVAGRVARAITKLTHKVGTLGALGIFCLMLVTAADVTARYVFNSPFLWGLEINEYLLLMVTFLALAYTEAQEGHINIAFVLSRLPLRVQAGMNVVTRSAVLFFCAVLTWQGWEVAWVSWLVRETSFSQVRTPAYPSRFVLVLGVSLMCLQLLVTIYKYARVMLEKESPVTKVDKISV